MNSILFSKVFLAIMQTGPVSRLLQTVSRIPQLPLHPFFLEERMVPSIYVFLTNDDHHLRCTGLIFAHFGVNTSTILL